MHPAPCTLLLLLVWDRLWEVGYQVGLRMLELQSFREKKVKRELEIVGILGFISVNVWKALFGERADSLERSTEHEDECTISRLASLLFTSLL
jgi:hypothetical protein